jgi:hypothetical protein
MRVFIAEKLPYTIIIADERNAFQEILNRKIDDERRSMAFGIRTSKLHGFPLSVWLGRCIDAAFAFDSSSYAAVNEETTVSRASSG